MTEPRARPPQVVRRKFRNLQFLRVHLDDVPDHLLCHSAAPYGARTTHAPKHFACGDLSRLKPFVQELLHPIRHRNCPNVATFSDEIHDRPTIFTTLKVVETEIGQFTSSETTAEEDRNDRAVSLAFEGFSIGRLPQCTRFFWRQ